MKDRKPTRDNMTVELETVISIATCRCGHTLEEHGQGCTVADCTCETIHDQVVEGEVEAVDELA